MMGLVAKTLISMALVILGLAPGCTTAQQSDANPQTIEKKPAGQGRGLEEFLTYEKEFAALVLRAKEISKVGTEEYNADVYYATLREGLLALGNHSAQQGRSASTRTLVRPNLSNITPMVVKGLDDSLEVRKDLDDAIERGLRGERIIGGSFARIGEFRETVAIVQQLGEPRYCTGVAVADGKVLTAAHCVCQMKLTRDGAGRANIQFGNPDANRVSDDIAREVKNSRTHMLDDEFCTNLSRNVICGGDLAILEYDGETPTHVEFPNIANDENLSGSSATRSLIVGHGDTRRSVGGVPRASRLVNGRRVRHKMFALIPTPPRLCMSFHNQCTQNGIDYGCQLGSEVVLIDVNRGADTCNGDSGGPVFTFNPNYSGPHLLYGITSRGV